MAHPSQLKTTDQTLRSTIMFRTLSARMSSNTLDDSLVVGIDFGTTFSGNSKNSIVRYWKLTDQTILGVAYAYSAAKPKPDQISVVKVYAKNSRADMCSSGS